MKQEFTLESFEPHDLQLSIDGFVLYQQGLLELSYHLHGDLAQVLFPTAVEIPVRQFALWEATCLEFFLAPSGQAEYWEFNLSPNGNWQVFHLDGYRQGLRDEAAINYLPFTVQQTSDSLKLTLSIDLTALVAPDTSLEMGITAVIQAKDGDYSYWALKHPGAAADFHLRDSFTIHW
jgi:hypothetical protein